MKIEIKVPEVGQTVSEVNLVRWCKEVGDAVERGDVLAEVETDKMVVELESFAKGKLVERFGEEGDTVEVDSVVAILESSKKSKKKAAAEPEAKAASVPADAEKASVAKTVVATGSRRFKASPAAKKLARETGVDLSTLVGTGVDGLIIRRNVEAARGSAAGARQAPLEIPASPFAHEAEPLSRARRAVGRGMALSKSEIPHFYVETEVCVDSVEADRACRNQGRAKDARITFTDYLVAACARALTQFPRFNAAFADNEIAYHPDVNPGLAIDTPHGLMLSAIEKADALALADVAEARRSVVARAHEGKVTQAAPSFTISNLGMLGATRFQAIVPPGQAAILAVGTIQKRPVLDAEGLRNQRVIALTLSTDHRVADGADAARFLGYVRELLEAYAPAF